MFSKKKFKKNIHTEQTLISRSEQAPQSVFHPRNESDQINCSFLGPSWWNKKVDPER